MESTIRIKTEFSSQKSVCLAQHDKGENNKERRITSNQNLYQRHTSIIRLTFLWCDIDLAKYHK